jgi:hypothetical protein
MVATIVRSARYLVVSGVLAPVRDEASDIIDDGGAVGLTPGSVEQLGPRGPREAKDPRCARGQPHDGCTLEQIIETTPNPDGAIRIEIAARAGLELCRCGTPFRDRLRLNILMSQVPELMAVPSDRRAHATHDHQADCLELIGLTACDR